ncbi:MAG: TonB-dependent receptor [Candidatus Marinimicrobia bacterium]|nr:TonB-dependent receptor [Candidatus Neomarinimicrobiota bacterium]
MKKRIMNHLAGLLFTLLVLSPINSILFAGITGTISGVVLDEKTQDPLEGVQIIISGTTKGSISNAKGEFILNNVSPGTYTVQFQYMGYNLHIQKNVTVLVDIQTSLNVTLLPTIIEGESVVVSSDYIGVIKNLTSTTRFISTTQLDELPIQNYQELVEMQPGVAAGHIRGGRKSEVLYMVDGIPIQEVIEGQVGSELPNTAIIDISVQTGGFNAEYGDAMSGVVNILTKEGQEKTFSKVQMNVLDNSVSFDPFVSSLGGREYKLDLALGGPLPISTFSYFISGDYALPVSQTIQEHFGVRRIILSDPNKSTAINLTGKISGLLLSNTLKLSLQAIFSNQDWTEYEHLWKYNLTNLPQRQKRSIRSSISISHTLTSQMFYEVNFSYYDVLKSILGSASAIQSIPVVSDSGFVLTGQYPWWMDHQEVHLFSSAAITNQLNASWQVKMGYSFTQYELYKKNVMRRDLGTWSGGYPIYLVYDSDYVYNPRKGAVYIQSKYEKDNLILNTGLRMDIFDPRATRPAIEIAQTDIDDSWVVDTIGVAEASVKKSISPRIGFAWIMEDGSKFHINYGYFFQMPAFEYLYANPNLNVANGFAPLGDADLEPSLTRAWEFGYLQPLGKNYFIDITVFNKDVINLIDSNTLLIHDADYSQEGFTQYVNIGGSYIRGAELYISSGRDKRVNGNIAYTVMQAKGTSSHSLDALLADTELYPRGQTLYPLSWDQRHTLVTNLDIKMNQYASVNIMYRYNSALPFTLDIGAYTQPNNERMEATSDLNIRLNGNYHLGSRISLTSFFEVTNLLDTRNNLWVDSRGLVGGELADPGAWNLGRRVRLGIGMKL